MAAILGQTITQLKAFMDQHLLRQGVISSNIANLDTPGYKAKEVLFEDHLNKCLSLEATHPAHRTQSESKRSHRIQTDPYSRIGNDANTVDIDREMMKLTQNQLLYNSTAQIIQNKLEGIKNTIRSIR